MHVLHICMSSLFSLDKNNLAQGRKILSGKGIYSIKPLQRKMNLYAKRNPLPKDLPREQIVHDIDDKTCTCCGMNCIKWVKTGQRS